MRRAGRTLGVLVVQNRASAPFTAEEVEALETVAMLLVEPLAASGASDGAEEGLGATVPRRFVATSLVAGIAIGPAVLPGTARAPPPAGGRPRRRDRPARPRRRTHAAGARRTDHRPAAEGGGKVVPEAREVLEAYRLVAADAGWLRRVSEAIHGGLSAEAAVHRVAGELRDRMRRIVDPYLRERLADLEDMAAAC